MTEYERFREKLAASLAADLPGVEVRARPSSYHKILGFVTAPTFEGMDDGDRQEIIWGAILDHFSPAEQERIEFIYTDAPSEVAAVTSEIAS